MVWLCHCSKATMAAGCLIAATVLGQPSAASAIDQRGQSRPRAKPSPAPRATRESIAASPELALQVALDRAGFSPGEIDGRPGAITKRALAAFQKERGLPQTAEPDEATWAALGVAPGNADQVVTQYVITPEDVKGPFTEQIPEDMMEKAQLPSLGYTGVLEALGERFHIAPGLLKALNPDAAFAAGTPIVVPAVSAAPPPPPTASRDRARGARRGSPPSGATGTSGRDAGVTVSVSKAAEALTVRDGAGRVIMFAPVTVGSEHDPLPLGQWKVTGVSRNPPFNYNPDLFWDADPAHTRARLPGGPNNPVGTVWVDLDREHYGIHGTPEPGRISYRQSHGCVRLTNWDAEKLASLVKPGTPVLFEP
jgi:lipoprotein-anchoring transpeptidase ErfK/SrfK